jgi:hypothetical protein
VHFLAEFELAPCHGCRARARIRIGAPAEWRCRGCRAGAGPAALPLHPDLWRALATGEESETSCPACRERVPLGRCWISPDARRLFCADHLRPIEAADRLRRAARFLLRAPAAPPGTLERLAAHLAGERCGTCPFNGSGVYEGARLVEVDPDRRLCTSAPDSLNCANLEH